MAKAKTMAEAMAEAMVATDGVRTNSRCDVGIVCIGQAKSHFLPGQRCVAGEAKSDSLFSFLFTSYGPRVDGNVA